MYFKLSNDELHIIRIKNAETAALVTKNLLQIGINAATCGEKSVRIRPSLIFQQKHAEVYLERLSHVLDRLKLTH